MNKSINVSKEVAMWLHMQGLPGESVDATLRRFAGLDPRRRGREPMPKGETKDRRKKYPVLDMLPGDELLVPWNRDEKGEAQLGGLNAAISRCNRLEGRKYRATPQASGLHIIRLT